MTNPTKERREKIRSEKVRLDKLLVDQGHAASRERAQALILAGRVLVDEQRIDKPGTSISATAQIRLLGSDLKYVSRGGLKLEHALVHWSISLTGLPCVDIGASTGGFTDVLLSRGAGQVVAADVGYGQLIWRLRSDERVHVLDRTNVRSLTPEAIGGQVSLTVSDLSFISLRTVLPALTACTEAGGDLVPMVKPQFEVGRRRLGPGGVVREPELRVAALREVADAAAALGWYPRGAVASPAPGPAGNVEFFLWLSTGPGTGGELDETVDAMLERAVREGPQ